MNSTVEGRVEYWEEHGETVYSPLEESEAAAIRHATFDRNGDAVYEILMSDGSEFRIAGNECSCGNVVETPLTSEVTAWRKRLARSCDHQRAQLKSVNVGGRCPDCGELSVVAEDHTDKYGNVLLKTFHCAGCGASRREQ